MADQLEQNYEQKQEFIKQLEQKNMELECFTYTVSHELKSLLVTVNGFVGLLQKDLAADNRDNIADDMSEKYADHARIREVVENLIENSIRFTPPDREPCIEIEAESRCDQLICRVRGNGVGIEPRYQSRVFGLFDRLDIVVPGTGVGLAPVKRIVEIHDGNIWSESLDYGQGSCFCFTLPIRRGS